MMEGFNGKPVYGVVSFIQFLAESVKIGEL